MMASTTRLWDYFEGFAKTHYKKLTVKNHADFLPMHCAINNGLMWMEHIFDAFSEAVTQPYDNGLHPFLFSVLAKEKRAFNQCNRDTMHNMLYFATEIEKTFHCFVRPCIAIGAAAVVHMGGGLTERKRGASKATWKNWQEQGTPLLLYKG
jgi:hypothetical protein